MKKHILIKQILDLYVEYMIKAFILEPWRIKRLLGAYHAAGKAGLDVFLDNYAELCKDMTLKLSEPSAKILQKVAQLIDSDELAMIDADDFFNVSCAGVDQFMEMLRFHLNLEKNELRSVS